MLKLSRIFFILLLFIVPLSANNHCGGSKPLYFELGEFCETHNAGGCPYGRIECLDKNSVICIPNCNITTKVILSLSSKTFQPPPDTSISRDCKNGGLFDEQLGVCVCPMYFHGPQCDIQDLCASIKCGSFGHCENGVCVCDFLFTGRYCELRKDCEPPNFVWTGNSCICQDGFAGSRCDQCTEGLVCLPVRNRPKQFGAMIIKDPSLLDNIIDKQPPPLYHGRPYIPTVHEACQCSSQGQQHQVKEQFSMIEHFVSEHQSSRQVSPEDYSLYVHHLYQHHYMDKDECELTWMTSVCIIITTILGILACCCCCCHRCRSQPPPKLVVPVSYHPPLPPPPQPQQQQQQIQQTYVEQRPYNYEQKPNLYRDITDLIPMSVPS